MYLQIILGSVKAVDRPYSFYFGVCVCVCVCWGGGGGRPEVTGIGTQCTYSLRKHAHVIYCNFSRL